PTSAPTRSDYGAPTPTTRTPETSSAPPASSATEASTAPPKRSTSKGGHDDSPTPSRHHRKRPPGTVRRPLPDPARRTRQRIPARTPPHPPTLDAVRLRRSSPPLPLRQPHRRRTGVGTLAPASDRRHRGGPRRPRRQTVRLRALHLPAGPTHQRRRTPRTSPNRVHRHSRQPRPATRPPQTERPRIAHLPPPHPNHLRGRHHRPAPLPPTPPTRLHHRPRHRKRDPPLPQHHNRGSLHHPHSPSPPLRRRPRPPRRHRQRKRLRPLLNPGRIPRHQSHTRHRTSTPTQPGSRHRRPAHPTHPPTSRRRHPSRRL